MLSFPQARRGAGASAWSPSLPRAALEEVTSSDWGSEVMAPTSPCGKHIRAQRRGSEGRREPLWAA